MKQYPVITLLCVAVLVLLGWQGCTPKRAAVWQDTFTDTVYAPRYATGFHILTAPHGESSLITVKNPWQGASGVEQHYFVRLNDEQPPEGFDGIIVPGGAQRIVCLSSTYVGMLEELGKADRIVGVSGLDFIHNEYVRSHPEQVKEVGAEMNYETLLGLRPDLVMIYGVDDSQTLMTDKLNELGIPYIYMGEYLEDTPLGRAEWLNVVAEIIGLREEGRRTFAGIAAEYEHVSRLAAGAGQRPTVMLNTPWNDTWTLPDVHTYFPRFLQDAGAAYIFTDDQPDKGATRIGLETAYTLLHRADYWLNVSSATSLDDLRAMNARFAEAKAFRDKRVYNNNLRLTPGGGNDFWESSVVRPDRVLRDLISIFHPEILQDSLYYYRRLE